MASLTKTSATVTATAVLAANSGRSKGGLTLENSDTNRCFVLFGPGTASATNYSVSLAQNAPLTIQGMADQVSVVWGTAATGALMCTEWMN